MHTWVRSPLACKVRGRAGEALEARPCWPDPPLTLSSLVPNAPCLYPKSPDITRYRQGYAVAKTDDGRDILPRGDPLFHAQRPNPSGAAQLDAHAPTSGHNFAWSTDRPVGENRWMSRSPDDIARALLVATHGAALPAPSQWNLLCCQRPRKTFVRVGQSNHRRTVPYPTILRPSRTVKLTPGLSLPYIALGKFLSVNATDSSSPASGATGPSWNATPMYSLADMRRLSWAVLGLTFTMVATVSLAHAQSARSMRPPAWAKVCENVTEQGRRWRWREEGRPRLYDS